MTLTPNEIVFGFIIVPSAVWLIAFGVAGLWDWIDRKDEP